MKKVLAVLFVFTFIFVSSFACGEAFAGDEADITRGEKLTIRWYSVLPENHPSIMAYADVFKEIAEETKGRIRVDLTAGGVLGTEQEGFDMIRDGTIHGGMMNSSYYESYVPDSQGWIMPFTFRDYKTAMAYFNEHAITNWNMLIKDSTNTIALNAVSPGFRCLTTRDTEVKSPKDAARLKIRSMESPMSQAYVHALGGFPVPLAWAEVYMGLSTGSIDGQENPIAHIDTYNLFEVQKYLIYTEHALVLSWSIVNVDFWNKLSQTDRDYLSMKFAEQSQKAIEYVEKYTKDTFAALESKYNMKVVTEENGLDKAAFIENADKYLKANFSAPEYAGWWNFRNDAVEWCSKR